eukprot:GHVP01059701.1.p1 GENE.GHVP01059701.1~~GHVP01059701.1.p1  ORF type:complete len:106 (-),score=16.62 GHVP01059701.1:230-547(-)
MKESEDFRLILRRAQNRRYLNTIEETGVRTLLDTGDSDNSPKDMARDREVVLMLLTCILFFMLSLVGVYQITGYLDYSKSGRYLLTGSISFISFILEVYIIVCSR